MSISATIRLKTGPVTIVGSYRHSPKGPNHAVIKNDSISPYGALCGSHQHISTRVHGVTFKAYKRPFSTYVGITCKKCLRIMEKYGDRGQGARGQGARGAEMNIPDGPRQKKFFLVFYDAGETRIIFDMYEMLDEIKRHGSDITKILLIDCYRTILTKGILVEDFY